MTPRHVERRHLALGTASIVLLIACTGADVPQTGQGAGSGAATAGSGSGAGQSASGAGSTPGTAGGESHPDAQAGAGVQPAGQAAGQGAGQADQAANQAVQGAGEAAGQPASSSSGQQSGAQAGAAPGGTDATARPAIEFQTPEFDVAAGSERYLCYTQTLERDLNIGAFEYDARPVVHHFLLAKTLAPEPEGLFECNVLFRSSWIPLFGAGSGDAELAIPAGAAQILPAGTQLLVQLHLLNAQTTATADRATIRMFEVAEPDPQPVGIYAFGTDQIVLDPAAPGMASNDCAVPEDVELFALLPHMHYLGTRLTFELGESEDGLSEVFVREPWDFDRQIIEPFAMTIPSGTLTRTTCYYDNTTDEAVGFGESSLDEMCFLVGYRVGHDGLGGCVEYSGGEDSGQSEPSDPDAGECGAQEANAEGIGAACTPGGGECAFGLSCSVDQAQTPDGAAGFCLRIGGCASNADCGGGDVTCCGTAESGGLVPICVPEACRPDNCIPR